MRTRASPEEEAEEAVGVVGGDRAEEDGAGDWTDTVPDRIK
jgi:hypothetical protein